MIKLKFDRCIHKYSNTTFLWPGRFTVEFLNRSAKTFFSDRRILVFLSERMEQGQRDAGYVKPWTTHGTWTLITCCFFELMTCLYISVCTSSIKQSPVDKRDQTLVILCGQLQTATIEKAFVWEKFACNRYCGLVFLRNYPNKILGFFFLIVMPAVILHERFYKKIVYLNKTINSRRLC